MHELAIVNEIYEQAAHLARDHNAVVITEVQVDIGRLRQLVDEVAQTAWLAVTRDTLAHSARLIIQSIPIQLRCRSCQTLYPAEPDDFLCPGCRSADADILTGDEIILKSVTCFTHEELHADQSDQTYPERQ